MKYSKLMLIMVFAIFICTVSATCAADANETTIATQEDNQMELTLTEDEIQTNENDNMLTQTEDAEILTSGEGSYSDLRNDINSGGNLTRSHYRYNDGDGGTIGIHAPGVINGNGAVIDMAGSNIRAFYVSASDVTIKNLTIINANYGGDGGAIYFVNTGTVTNCNFINNKATGTDSWGGAVYFSSTGTVTNCNFTDNYASTHGGAVCFSSTGTVTNCNFTDNSASGNGGAVYFIDQGTVSNCNFVNNSASTHGGAVWIYSGTVSNCNFINNTATENGGAVRMTSGSVENCNFTGNTATRYGGAVYFSSTGTVTNCNFTGNTATGNGGAVYFVNNGTVSNCNFTDNSARDGGAINMGDGTVSNCNFTGNTASDDGGAIYFTGTGSVTNCNFTGNTASDYGGAIYFISTGSVTDCNFTGNNATGDGGAIRMSSGTVTNCNFAGNTAGDWGGAIKMYSGTVSNCNFTKNSASTGSAIYFYQYSSSDTLTISNSSFMDNRANAESLIVVENKNNITITFIGGNNLLNAIYSENDAEVTFANVSYWGADGIMNTDDGNYLISKNETGQNITISGVVNGNIINTIKSTDASGKIDLEGISGEYYLTFCHDEDSYYTMVEATVTNIENYTVTIISQTTNNKTVNITAKSNIYSEHYGDLIFIFPNGDYINANYASYGIWWYVYEFADYAQYNIAASFDGLGNVTINNATITIERANSTLTINDNITFDYGSAGSTTVNFTNATGINATVIGQPKAIVNVVNNTITVSGLDAGTYTLNVTTIVDDNHNPVTQTATITVNKIKTQITADAITTTYNVNKYLVITLKDTNGNPLKGISISVDLNGAKTYTTDSNGQVKVPTKGLAPKTYTAKVTFNGNTNYIKSAKDVKVTVKKAASKITAGKKTFKANTKVKKYAAVLNDSTGKAIKKAKLTLKVKGKTYAAKTNSKGKAVFKITKLNKKGTYKAVIKYKGDKYYAKSGKNVKIIVKASKSKSTFKTVSRGSKDAKSVKKIQQALKDHGYYLTYQGHYLKVDGKYNSCTVRSVKQFQKDHGLKQTGKVDVKTAKKLGII